MMKFYAVMKKNDVLCTQYLCVLMCTNVQKIITAYHKAEILLGRKVMTNRDSILKSRDITLLRKVHLVKAMIFPVVMYGCESWSIKQAECWRTDAFELWCWRIPLGFPWTARSNQSILRKISPGYSLIRRIDAEAEGPILWPPDVKSWLIGKDPNAG